MNSDVSFWRCAGSRYHDYMRAFCTPYASLLRRYRDDSQEPPELAETLLTEVPKLPRMERGNRGLELREQTPSVAGNPSDNDATISSFPSTRRETVTLQAVEEPRYIRVAAGRALGDVAERDPGRAGVAKNSKDMILLRRNARGLEQRRQLVNELPRDVLEKKVDLPLDFLPSVGTPGLSDRTFDCAQIVVSRMLATRI